MSYSDTAIFVFLPLFIVELVAPAAEEYVCYGYYYEEYRAQYGKRIPEHSFCGTDILFLAAHKSIPLLLVCAV